jgi:hypothetical protein
MFTPPGLKGRQFRITGNSFPRLRRPHQRRRHILLAIAGVLTLSVLSWGTVQLVGIFGGDRKATAAATCVLRQGEAASGSGDGLALVAGPAPRASGSASAHARTVAGASPAATAAAAAALPGAGITVNVFNATDQSGLAGRTAALLKQRGFTIGRIGNAPAPLQNKVTGPAQVTGGPPGVPRPHPVPRRAQGRLGRPGHRQRLHRPGHPRPGGTGPGRGVQAAAGRVPALLRPVQSPAVP